MMSYCIESGQNCCHVLLLEIIAFYFLETTFIFIVFLLFGKDESL